ncbi:MAG: DNA polymerase III subunit chi [Pseudomonadota bacterium]|nr:DNA polymerase III subunit chi [Pseudomonadota bacterium]
MTDRVDFYVLKSSTATQRWTFACRLTEKAYLRDLKVVLFSETAADAKVIDEMLWTFNERSFVPHEVHGHRPVVGDAAAPRVGGAASMPAPVQLTPDLDAIDTADLLVNLSDRLPPRMERFSRIAEIIDTDDERRRLGRERFKAYRELKVAVETHQLDDVAG